MTGPAQAPQGAGEGEAGAGRSPWGLIMRRAAASKAVAVAVGTSGLPAGRIWLAAMWAGLGLWAVPAAALMPPAVYEKARNTAASVVVLEVQAVTPPADGFGACRVEGLVRRVERGSVFKPGAAITLQVPCRKPGAQPPIGGTLYQPVESLVASKYGRAWLDAAGQVVLSQYQQLQRLP